MKENIKVLGIAVVGIIILFGIYNIFPVTAEDNSIERFESIPERPDDFDAYTREIWKGGLVDLCGLDDSYWKQPEFYGDSWTISKDKFYTNPDYSRWGVYGQGNIPREISYSFSKLSKGDEFELCSFFHNGFGVWTYQGFELVPWESEDFDIEITPNELTLSPTFPVFEDGWAEQIHVKIIAKKDLEPGNYILGFDVIPPSDEYGRVKNIEVLNMNVDKVAYKKECYEFLEDEETCNTLINLREKKYVNGGSYQTSEPIFKLVVHIE